MIRQNLTFFYFFKNRLKMGDFSPLFIFKYFKDLFKDLLQNGIVSFIMKSYDWRNLNGNSFRKSYKNLQRQ